jgi:hypothetical protein
MNIKPGIDIEKILNIVENKLFNLEQKLLELRNYLYPIIRKYSQLPQEELDEKMSSKMGILEKEADDEVKQIISEIELIVDEINSISQFSLRSKILQHSYFNELCDWFDILNRDIPEELKNIKEFKNQILVLRILNDFSVEVQRSIPNILNGDFDAALKVTFNILENKIRDKLNLSQGDSIVNEIAKAFNEDRLVALYKGKDMKDHARNFLMGVMGYYRNIIAHNKEFADEIKNFGRLISLLCIANEASILFDKCYDNAYKLKEQKIKNAQNN